MKFFVKIPSLLLFILIFLGVNSCKKEDMLIATQNKTVAKFLSLQSKNDPIIKRITTELERQQKLNPKFIPSIIERNGYPLWDKNQIIKKSNIPNIVASNEDTIVYIPLAVQGEDKVSAFFIATINEYITLELYNKFDYEQFGFDTIGTSNANKLAIQFMVLDFIAFGHKDFKLHDERLLKDFEIATDILIGDRTIHVDYALGPPSESSGWTTWDFLICKTTRYLNCSSNASCCTRAGVSPGACSACEGCWKNKTVCEKVSVLVFYDYEYEPPTGGEGGGGGGSNTSINTNTIQPCSPTPLIQNGLPPCPKGSTLGWEPINIEPNFIPYHCSYQLEQHEQDIFTQIDDEDRVSDQNHQSLDCQGTKRTGNLSFKGTKQHWLIQLDYLSKNPIYGDVEYAIPNSSPSGNRGYADIVNYQTKSIFEIKPNNTYGQTSGAVEVANYVTKANIYCNSTLPNVSSPWSTGNTYLPTLIPTSTPNVYLKAQLFQSGVIVYENIITSVPVPTPVLLPSPIINKMKHLIDRLKQNFQNADKIIAEYLRQNPDLVTYIKGAAIAAGVATIVGTILEDVITAGVGIADDWGCFVLSYRIIRFAIAL